MPNDSIAKTLLVAGIVAFVCSLLVTTTVVTLRPYVNANLEAVRIAQLQKIVSALPGMEDVLAQANVDALQRRMINLQTGEFATAEQPEFDLQNAAGDVEQTVSIDPAMDYAGIGRRVQQIPVFLVERDGKLALVVLPVYGAGYQSLLFGYLALESDLNTIASLTFFDQGETPGLGARIQDGDWESLWPGKKIADENGDILISVVKGSAQSIHEVDGITGATRTGTGVSQLLRFWLGDNGYGPFLDNMRGDIQ
jgi:Na+-transporting NADH:ubiquinone oxidoreductase subunit C